MSLYNRQAELSAQRAEAEAKAAEASAKAARERAAQLKREAKAAKAAAEEKAGRQKLALGMRECWLEECAANRLRYRYGSRDRASYADLPGARYGRPTAPPHNEGGGFRSRFGRTQWSGRCCLDSRQDGGE